VQAGADRGQRSRVFVHEGEPSISAVVRLWDATPRWVKAAHPEKAAARSPNEAVSDASDVRRAGGRKKAAGQPFRGRLTRTGSWERGLEHRRAVGFTFSPIIRILGGQSRGSSAVGAGPRKLGPPACPAAVAGQKSGSLGGVSKLAAVSHHEDTQAWLSRPLKHVRAGGLTAPAWAWHPPLCQMGGPSRSSAARRCRPAQAVGGRLLHQCGEEPQVLRAVE